MRQLKHGLPASGRRWRLLLVGGPPLLPGFVNRPTEWRHESYGDRHWAMVMGAAEAT